MSGAKGKNLTNFVEILRLRPQNDDYFNIINAIIMAEEEKLSRREFLKTGLAGGAFFAEIFSSKRALAELEKLLPAREFFNETFAQGLDRLRTAVFEEKQERFFAYVKKNKTEGWLNIEGVMMEDMGQSIDLLPLLEDAKIEMMHFVHTHPILMAEKKKLLPPETIQEAKRDKKTKFPFLPSSADILTLLRQKIFMKEQGMRYQLKHSVLDPAGIWEYDVDPSHPKMEEITKSLQYEKKRGKTDDELIIALPHEEMEFGLDLQLQDKQQRFYKDSAGITERELKNLQDWAKKEWGIILTFTPY